MSDVLAGLPGVMPEDGGEGEHLSPAAAGKSAGQQVRAGAQASGVLRGGTSPARGAASAGQGGAELGRPEPAAGEPAVVDDTTLLEQPEAAEPFTFAGRSWGSQAEAEQHLTRIDANLRTQQRLVSDLQRTAREAISVATAWQQHGAQAGVQQGQQPGRGAEPAAPEQPWYQDPQVLDLDFVRRLADEQGIDTALLHFAQTADKVYTERFSKLLDDRLSPILMEREAGRVYQGAMGAFQAVADDVDGAGQPAYPELHSQDPATHEAIVRIWRQMGRAGLEMGDDGVRVAVLKFRRAVAAGQLPPPSAAAAPVVPLAPSAPSAARVVRNLAGQAAGTSQVLSGTGTPRPATPGESDPAARLKASLRQAGRPVVDRNGFNLGFTPD